MFLGCVANHASHPRLSFARGALTGLPFSTNEPAFCPSTATTRHLREFCMPIQLSFFFPLSEVPQVIDTMMLLMPTCTQSTKPCHARMGARFVQLTLSRFLLYIDAFFMKGNEQVEHLAMLEVNRSRGRIQSPMSPVSDSEHFSWFLLQVDRRQSRCGDEHTNHDDHESCG